MSTHIRVQKDTKKAVDQALITAKAENPNIRTHDDLQRHLLTLANLRPMDDIIRDDLRQLENHLKLLHPNTPPKTIEGIIYNLEEIMIIGCDVKPDIVLKRIRDIKKEIE